MTGLDASAYREMLVGGGLFFLFVCLGFGVLMISRRIAGVLQRVDIMIGDVDKQIGTLSEPIVDTLSHVGGIADTADIAVAKLGKIVGTLESVAGSVGKTANLAQNAVAPSLVNFGATLTGITAGVRRIIHGPHTDKGGA